MTGGEEATQTTEEEAEMPPPRKPESPMWMTGGKAPSQTRKPRCGGMDCIRAAARSDSDGARPPPLGVRLTHAVLRSKIPFRSVPGWMLAGMLRAVLLNAQGCWASCLGVVGR